MFRSSQEKIDNIIDNVQAHYREEFFTPPTKGKVGMKDIEAWLQWIVTSKCNLACDYCIERDNKLISIKAHIFNLIKKIKKSKKNIPASVRILKSKMRKIDIINIPALIRTLDRTNKIFQIGFSGGEPFLVTNLIEASIEITKKHYISLNTNLTSKKIEEFSEKINPKRVVNIWASLHIKELERLNLLDRYIYNFLLCKEKGFHIFAREVAYPPLLGEVDKYKKFFKEKGIELEFGIFKGKYDGRRYPDSYTVQERKNFGLDRRNPTRALATIRRGNLCNAGYNVGVVFSSGIIQSCFEFGLEGYIGDIYKKIEFKNKMIRCPFERCDCPLDKYNPTLFKKALEEQNLMLITEFEGGD